MVTQKRIVIGLAILLALIAGYVFFQSDTKRVKKQFAHLSDLVSKEPNESPFTLARKIQDLGKLFAQSCELIIPIDAISASFGPQEITGYATRGRASFSELTLKFYDLSVEFPEKRTARVRLTASLTGKMGGGDKMDDTREVQCLLKKIGNRWLFTKLEVIEVLKK